MVGSRNSTHWAQRLGQNARVRLLFVSDEFPWPADNGYRARVANLISGLYQLASVDLFVASDARRPDDRRIPAEVGLDKVCSVDRPVLRGGAGGLWPWLSSGRPRALAWRDWTPTGTVFSRFVEDRSYDCAWFSHVDMFLALRARLPARLPAIVDVDNLEWTKISHRLEQRAVPDRSERWAERLDVGRWRRVELGLADQASVVLVCSELDRSRLGDASNVIVVPNGYERPDGTVEERRPRPLRDGPPTALFVGFQGYPPNADASRWLVEGIWPRVRQRLPDAELRIVGGQGESLHLAGPGVVVTGAVGDMSAEIAAAHVAAMPLRFGGGTRIKVLEAFANGLPVAATPMAVEGIGCRSDQDLLVGSSASELAEACARLLTEDALRARLAAAAQDLWRRTYRWERVHSLLPGALSAALGEL